MTADIKRSEREPFLGVTEWGLANGINLKIKTDFPLSVSQKNILMAESYLPGFRGEPSKKPEGEVVMDLRQAQNTVIFQEPHKLTWRGMWNESLNLDFFHAAYAMERLSLIDVKLFPTHAACVGTIDGGYMLLAAYPSNGKTSTLLNLVGEYGQKVFSGDKTVISFSGNSLTAEAGTKAVTARPIVFERYAPKISKTGYLDRNATFLPPDFYETSDKVNISRIAIIREDPAVSESEYLPEVSAAHKLFPFFMDVTNADKLIYGANGAMTGFVNGTVPEESRMYLGRKLIRVTENIKTQMVTGSIEFITEKLMNQK